MHYLDTCICIEFLRGRLKSGYEHMRVMRREDFQLPSIVIAELFYGAEHSDHPERDIKTVEAFVSAFEVAVFDAAAAREYGRLWQQLGSQGKLIGDRDLMIAATALVNRASLVTNNLKEFKRVEGLKVESWTETDL